MTAASARSAAPPRRQAAGAPRDDPWTTSPTVLTLSLLAGLLALTAAVAGLVWQTDGAATSATTLWGEHVELFGRGLYRNDTLFVAGANVGADIVMLTLGLPALVGALVWSRHGSARGRLLLLGALGYVVYHGASYALGAVAYNELFLVYVGTFSASLFALVTAFSEVDPQRLPVSDGMPRRWIGGFMIASGVVTLSVWLADPVVALLTGTPPATLGTHTTLFTHALDMAVIAPTAVASGVLIVRSRPLGYLLAAALLLLEALLLPLIAIATVVQVRSGVSFTTAEVVGPIVGFATISLLALWVLVTMLRHMGRA